MDGLLSGKYEIIVNNSDYILNSINIADNEYTSLSVEDGKYYLIIQDVPKDTKATLVLDLEKKQHTGYQTSYDINNFWKTTLSTLNEIAPASLFSDYVEAPLPEEIEINEEEPIESLEEESTELETTEEMEDTENEDDTENKKESSNTTSESTENSKDIEEFSETENSNEPSSSSEKSNSIEIMENN